MIQPTADASSPFSAALHAYLTSHLSQQEYATWFRRVRFERTSSERIQIGVPTRFHMTYLQHRYMGAILEALDRAASIAQPQIDFRVSSDGTAPSAAAASTGEPRSDARAASSPPAVRSPMSALPMGPVQNGLPLNPGFTFEQFVTGPTNRLAHAASLAVAQSPGRAYNPLFIYGSVGLGKTHLLQAVAHEYRRAGMENVLYLSCEGFTNDFIAAVSRNDLERFREKYRRASALLLDDVQLLAKRERTQEQFFHTFNALYNEQKQILLTSDCLPSEIAGLGERLVSRFKLGLVAELMPPAFETRVAIVLRKAENLRLAIPPEIAQLVADHVRDNVREIEGALHRLHSMVTIEKKSLTPHDAEAAILEILGKSSSRLDLATIQERVLQEFGVASVDLHSKSRARSIVIPRQVCMFLARRHTRHSLGEIGGYFGGRDHSTVLHAVDKIEGLLLEDAILRGRVAGIERRLGR